MSKLLNLTIKIDKDGYKNAGGSGFFFSPPRIIEHTGLVIKDQTGTIVTQLKIESLSFGSGNFLVNDIKKIQISFGVLDIPISWAWENKDAADAEIEFTLKNLKYDENKGFKFGNVGTTTAGAAADTLFLTPDDFEAEVYKNKEGFENKYLSSIIELSDKFSTDIKKTFRDFLDLNWKITKAGDEETIKCFVSEIESYQKATAGPKQKLYQLKSDSTKQEVKNICDNFLKEVGELDSHWKNKGIKTLAETRIAKENGFDLTTDLGLSSQISSEGKYKGFPIASLEKYQAIASGSSFTSNRYTKDNIDMFRDFFANDLDQSDPKYFRGFRPGDIVHLSNGKFASVNHQVDIQDKVDNQWEIKKNEDFTRGHYEIKSCDKQNKLSLANLINITLKNIHSKIGKTRKEILDTYFDLTKELGYSESRGSKLFRQELTSLFGTLDQNFINENRENCETALNILKTYQNLPDSKWIENKIKDRYLSEMEAKKTEITDRLKVLFQTDIDKATNEDYGSGSLSPERKRIFTTYRSQITTLSLLTEIKELVKSLVKAEKSIAEFKNLDKMALLKKLKEEYQQGSGEKKTAYTIVNQVDNQWVDRIITELGTIKAKDPQILLAESRTQLKTKYANDTVAQAIFDNQVLDSWQAVQEAEKLLIKVREAEVKNEVDAALLTLLQGYQKAEIGTLKNKAWQAVNSYNQQAEAALTRLQKVDQAREEIVKTLQEAKNESELEAVYNRAKDSELYKQGGSSKRVIRNLRRRKIVSFQLNQENFSTEDKTFLQTALVKLIPETIKDDNGERELTELENQLKTFSTAPESEEKGEIYSKYKKTIDQVLTEIRQEKQRYQQSKQPDSNREQTPKPSAGRLPDWVWGLVMIGVIVVVGTFLLYSILYFYQRSRRSDSAKKKKKHKIKLKNELPRNFNSPQERKRRVGKDGRHWFFFWWWWFRKSNQ